MVRILYLVHVVSNFSSECRESTEHNKRMGRPVSMSAPQTADKETVINILHDEFNMINNK